MKFAKLIKAEEISEEAKQAYYAIREKIENIALQYDYKARVSYDFDKNKLYRISLDSKYQFKPNIDIYFESDSIIIEIQTIAHGAINLDDYNIFIDNCISARECAQELKKELNNWRN